MKVIKEAKTKQIGSQKSDLISCEEKPGGNSLLGIEKPGGAETYALEIAVNHRKTKVIRWRTKTTGNEITQWETHIGKANM